METQTIPTTSTLLSDITEDSGFFPHEKIHEALMYSQEVLERSSIPFMLLDETAHQIMKTEMPTFRLSEISIGIMKRHWTESGKSIFNMIVPQAEETNMNISYTVGDVPVIMWIIEREFSFFQYPDVRFYFNSEFKIPNPWREYWKSRDLIK